jgi:GntR family transcriptional regulator
MPRTSLAASRGGGMPMYAQLLATFRRRIETGEWAIGERVPTLDDLTNEFGVARVTVRHAIGLLEAEGLIGRYRGRGTFVLKAPQSAIWYRIPVSWDELVGLTPDIDFEWLDNNPAEVAPTPFHGKGEVAAEYQFLRRRLLRHHIPYCVGITYIERTAFDAIGTQGFGAPIPLAMLNTHLKGGIGGAEQTIRVGTAELATARLLDLPPGSPLMVVARSVLDVRGVLIYESLGYFRGDFVEAHMQLR